MPVTTAAFYILNLTYFSIAILGYSKESQDDDRLDENGIQQDQVAEFSNNLHRRLGCRQIQRIAIGGSIGTALFVTIGNGVAAEVQGLLLAYTLYFLVVVLEGLYTSSSSLCRSYRCLCASHPRKSIKLVYKTMYWRFRLFFILDAMCVGILVPSDDPKIQGVLIGETGGAGTDGTSSYVIAMNSLGIGILPHLANALLITSIFSAGNTYTYCPGPLLICKSDAQLSCGLLPPELPRLPAVAQIPLPTYLVAVHRALVLLELERVSHRHIRVNAIQLPERLVRHHVQPPCTPSYLSLEAVGEPAWLLLRVLFARSLGRPPLLIFIYSKLLNVLRKQLLPFAVTSLVRYCYLLAVRTITLHRTTKDPNTKMATVSEMIDLVWWPPRPERGVKRPHIDRTLPENFKYYGNWGFTIYRTYYSPESDEHWDMLLDALKRQTYLALRSLDVGDQYREDVEQRKWERCHGENKDEYLEDLKRLTKLFYLDPREDPPLLDGLNIRQLREVCLSEHPKVEKTMAGGRFHFVLVADEAVLKDIAKGEFVIKSVAYDWEEGGEYWGWMRIPTGYLLELWHSLMMSGCNYHRVLRFEGPEEDLEEYIWPGDTAADPTSRCSEVRRGFVHYSAQRPRFKVERN
ncbi:hypothetical protein G7Z17_g10229 [Cylindrodendrum hubeiense]|uniref:Amino acid permease/ SLC12A domain-containing protein n=1 Tax=Cylindrodendrum hubeiense TaxID=595255 RepID=A0A9P5GY20_9HYPO|nr:hypothetical protein G7Z17_g10229 [Cylindrodendrum hubeiense]